MWSWIFGSKTTATPATKELPKPNAAKEEAKTTKNILHNIFFILN